MEDGFTFEVRKGKVRYNIIFVGSRIDFDVAESNGTKSKAAVFCTY